MNAKSLLKQLYLIKISKVLDYNFHFYSDFSMSLYGLVFLINEINLNNRKNIIEFGSGISSICMAQLIKKRNINAKIVSVESDIYWFRKVSTIVKKEGLDDILELFHVPLSPYPALGKANKWYNNDVLAKKLKNYKPFDMVVIDGPPAYEKEFELSRYGAISFVKSYLSPNHVIFLDDANRDGEMAVIKLWEKEFGFKWEIFDQRIAVHRKGCYNPSNPNLIMPSTFTYELF